MVEKLTEIRNALNQIEVKGQENLYYLLVSIQELNDLIAEQNTAQSEVVKDG